MWVDLGGAGGGLMDFELLGRCWLWIQGGRSRSGSKEVDPDLDKHAHNYMGHVPGSSCICVQKDISHITCAVPPQAPEKASLLITETPFYFTAGPREGGCGL